MGNTSQVKRDKRNSGLLRTHGYNGDDVHRHIIRYFVDDRSVVLKGAKVAGVFISVRVHKATPRVPPSESRAVV